MQNLCEKIKNRLSCLPYKDFQLCTEYFKKRDFESILEIAKSVFIMKIKDDAKESHNEKWKNIDVEEVQNLISDTQEYLSYMDISDVCNEEDYYE
jgi:hypothetical protein